jgi:hypothetical protein
MLGTMLSAATLVVAVQPEPEEGFLAPLQGWNILQDDYDQKNPLDIISYEWDYFMIHDENFAGIVGYVVANPRNKLGDLIQIVPNGGNVGFVGEVKGSAPIANFETFGIANSTYGKESRTFDSRNPANGRFGIMTPLPSGGPNGVDAIRLEGNARYGRS